MTFGLALAGKITGSAPGAMLSASANGRLRVIRADQGLRDRKMLGKCAAVGVVTPAALRFKRGVDMHDVGPILDEVGGELERAGEQAQQGAELALRASLAAERKLAQA
jgi:hypothetical protein